MERWGRLCAWGAGGAMLAIAAGLAALSAVPALFGREVGAGFASVERSACVLDRDGAARIVVAGDSRAKSQLIPALITARTGERCVNIGEALDFGGDLATLVNVLRKNPGMLATGPMLVISVSMDGVNDMSVENAPAATLYNFSLADHLRLTAGRPLEYPRFLAASFLPALKRDALHRWRGDGFACGEGVYLPPAILAAGGYRPFQGQPPGPSAAAGRGKPGRYLLEGARWKVYRQSLSWLAASPARAVVLYDAPMDPEWLRSPEGRAPAAAESRFAAMAAREASLHAKVRFLDFFSRPVPELGPGDFYNGNHLNAAGAAIFTRILADSLAPFQDRDPDAGHNGESARPAPEAAAR
ncbi:MAG TPA: hypothetical protein VJ385_16655 [Fibrobacteria bacterium]|nr:hypothetical protein [Fibrobacteria bacterium]